jgi:G3E family GTPase
MKKLVVVIIGVSAVLYAAINALTPGNPGKKSETVALATASQAGFAIAAKPDIAASQDKEEIAAVKDDKPLALGVTVIEGSKAGLKNKDAPKKPAKAKHRRKRLRKHAYHRHHRRHHHRHHRHQMDKHIKIQEPKKNTK